MLGGIAPLFVFTFPFNPTKGTPAFNSLAGIPLIGDDSEFAQLVGLPIPIYLDERITGVYIDNQSDNLDIDTINEQRYDNGKMLTYQRGVNSSVTVNLLARRDSVFLAALLAFKDMIFQRLVSADYKLSYVNGPTVILAGLLQGFHVTDDPDTTLLRIAITVGKQDQRPVKQAPTLAAIEGPTLAGPTGITPGVVTQ